MRAIRAIVAIVPQRGYMADLRINKIDPALLKAVKVYAAARTIPMRQLVIDVLYALTGTKPPKSARKHGEA